MQQNITKMIPLSKIPRLLKDQHNVTIGYRKLYGMVLDGTVPIAQNPDNHYWSASPDDIPKIAKAVREWRPARRG